MLVKTQVIILHRFPYGDSSFVVKALSKERGVISILSKGYKKGDSAFKGALDPFAESEIVFKENLHAELQFLKEASILEWHSSIRKNLEYMAEASVMAEILLKFAPQGMPLEQEFSALKRALESLEGLSVKQAKSALARFLFELSDSFGFFMDMEHCGVCGNALNGSPVDFREDTGDMLCKNCRYTVATGRRAEYLRDLQLLSRGEIPVNISQTEAGILHYLRLHLGMQQKSLNSISYLKEIRVLCSTQNK